jgi:hypothetical protein
MKDLTKANKLIQEISAQNPHITPITPADYPLFQSFFDKEPHTYGNSWTYVTQGLYGIGPHNLGYKYYDGTHLSAVCVYPKIEQPDVNVFYWVRPMGEGILDIIDTIAKNVLKEKKVPTYVKKIFKSQFDYLQTKGFKDTKGFPWHSSCPSEDDTFPEIIYDVKKTLELLNTPPRTTNIRKSYRKAEQIMKNNSVVIISDNFEENAWKVTKDFFESDSIQQKKINLSSEYDYYNPIFSNPSRPMLERKLILMNDLPMGYYIMEKILEDYTNIHCLIILRDKAQYLVDYTMFYILENCKTTQVNFGGSEDLGIHNFKQKFKPILEQQMYWATIY